jgi:hypothetical protein
VLRAARERLAPILMTSLATGLALVPLVVLGDRPGHEIEHPLAVVILGGLLTSTLLNLFVTPLLYLRFGRRTGRPKKAVPALLLVAGLGLAGCQAPAQGADATVGEQPAAVEPAADGGPARVTLTDRAEEELGLVTGTVAAEGDGGAMVPFGAVVYDAEGASWTFVRVEEHTYLRAPITITRVVGDRATLTSGPPAGTEVVTVGAAFLVGAEAGISGGE